MTLPWKTAWVTGASTGIGRELVVQLARAGVRVAATARSSDKLAELAQQHPEVVALPGDVSDLDQMRKVHEEACRALGQIDLAVLNAGIWDRASAARFDATRAARTMAVNYQGLANGLEPVIAGMIARRSGQIALVSSVAGYRGLPMAAYYAPSKAAAISLAESLQCELYRHGVRVSVVNPGFVETPMTAVNSFPMPFIIKTDDAVRRMIKGLARGRFEVAFPFRMALLMKLTRVLPYPVYFWVARNVLFPKSDSSGSGRK